MNGSPQSPVLFIHGLWVHSRAWDPWIDLFTSKGYEASAPGWPGDSDTVEATRANPLGMDNVGIDAICHHYADIIEASGKKPIMIGHSFGGLIAQELLANDLAVAAIAIDPAPIKGVRALPFSQLRSGFPVLANPANRKRTVALTAKQFAYSFGNTLDIDESNALFEAWAIPGPGRPLFEDATANFTRNSPAEVDTHNAIRGPLLLTTGTLDHTVPAKVTREVFDLYADGPSSTEFHVFEGKGHSLTMDNGWLDVAELCLDWLDVKGLSGSPEPVTNLLAD